MNKKMNKKNAASEMTPRQAIRSFPSNKNNNDINDVKKILKDDNNVKDEKKLAPPPIGIPPVGNVGSGPSHNPYSKQSPVSSSNSNNKPPTTTMPPMPNIFDPNKNNNNYNSNNNNSSNNSSNSNVNNNNNINNNINNNNNNNISKNSIQPNAINNNIPRSPVAKTNTNTIIPPQNPSIKPTINTTVPMVNPMPTSSSMKNFSPTPTNAASKKKKNNSSSSSSSLFEQYLILLNYFLSLGIIVTSIIIVLIAISVQKHRDFSMTWLYEEVDNFVSIFSNYIITLKNNVQNFNIEEYKTYFNRLIQKK